MVILLFGILLSSVLWWRDMITESLYQGNHTFEVIRGLRMGFLIFILSEVMFFFSIFFAFFYVSLAPDVALGMSYPPIGISPIDVLRVPILNTLILLSRGVSLT
ncbi:hypothetical protein EYB45_11120 [Erythrobacteraceae bacterium CFH 75059]|nr:hypothetical protein EYB45_11120 [Erythrobacteraceae bacterium CFH 75059]